MADRDLRINAIVKASGVGDVAKLRQEMQRLETTTEELKRAVQRSEREFEEARATSVSLKTAYINLRDSGEGTQAMFRDLSKQIEKAQNEELEAVQTTKRLIAEFKELDGETGELSAEFRDLDNRLQKSEGIITGVTHEVRTMGTGFNRLSGDLTEAGTKIDKVGDEARRTADNVEKLGKDGRRAADGIDRMGDESRRAADGIDKLGKSGARFSAIGNIIADAVQDAARAVVEFAKESVQAFYDFERSSREIFTLIPEASGDMREQLTKDALALGTELGRLPDEILPSIYNALSAGVPQDNVIETVRIASEAARAGVADLDSTIKLGLGVLNAQVGGVSDLSDVYDQLFFIVKRGVITLPELNTVMSQVTSIAGEAGVTMQDISAAMIVMTRQGDTAAEAAELLSIMLTQLSTAGTTLATVFEEAAGKSFRQFAAEGGTLAEAMELLQGHADDTGQALGDILGGGSPFFRDTQAARGALELTGRHLEDLVKFSEEAEDQLGASAEAAAEMGEAAELGALQGKAAFEEFKIALGEASAEIAGPLIGNATEFLKLWSGNRASQVSNLTSQVVEQAKATGDYETAVNKLGTALDETYTTIGRAVVDDKTQQDLQNSLNDIYVSMARASGSAEEFQGALDALDVSPLYLPANVQELFDNAKAEQFAQSLENVDEKMARMASSFSELDRAGVPTVATLRAASEGALELADSLTTYGEDGTQNLNTVREEAIAAKEELIAANTEIAAVAEDRAARIAAAAEAERAAIIASREAYNGYALSILGGAEVESNWTDALFQTAGQLGINQGQFRELAEASGEYSEAQIRTALTEAAMRGAVEELGQQLKNGTITVGEAIEALGNFEEALANDYTATLEYDDFVRGEEQARATKDALLAAEGDYSASFTTTNTTVNVVQNVPVGGAQGGQPVPNYRGGNFQAFKPLIVGDGPNGEILPTTELVIFDQPGRVFSGAETGAILGQGGPGEPGALGGAEASPGVASGIGDQRPINVYLTLPNVTNGQQFVGELDQALIALQRAGVANT